MKQALSNPLKQQLLSICLQKVEEQIGQLETELKSLGESAASDTKSSMGDKYETSREMINLEKGKIAGQLANATKMRSILNGIDASKSLNKCALGALVETSQGLYFLAAAIGQVSAEGKSCFVISPGSPIGQQLMGKKAGDTFKLGPREIEVVGVM